MTPAAVLMRRTVFADVPGAALMAERGHVYDCVVNAHGAVAALVPTRGGGTAPLGLTAAEFTVVARRAVPEPGRPSRNSVPPVNFFCSIPYRPARNTSGADGSPNLPHRPELA